MADPIRTAAERLLQQLELHAPLHLESAKSDLRAALAAQPPAAASDNDLTAIAPLLWVLWHHQGARSPVGQAIRRYLGIAQFERLTPEQVTLAAQYQDLPPVEAAKSAPEGDPIRAALERALMSILGGLCYFTAEAKHAQLLDAERDLEDLRAALAAQPPAAAPASDGELVDLAGCVEAWAARLDEGTPEERLLGRVAAVLKQRQAPPHDGEVDALIKILSRIARMLDFMPDGPPNGPVIHRVIELLRQLAPASDEEREELARKLELLAGVFDPGTTGQHGLARVAALLRQPALAPAPASDGEREEREELAQWLEREAKCASRHGMTNIDDDEDLLRAATLLRQPSPAPAAVAVAVNERPWEREGWCDAEGRCWFGAPVAGAADAGWILRKPSERLSHQITSLPHWAIPIPQGGEVGS